MSDKAGSNPVELGDGRRKHVTIVSDGGDQITYSDSYLRHSETAFIISSDESFPPDETTRYTKDEIHRIEIDQHHSRCFITTAVATDKESLRILRDFRDDVFANSLLGEALIAVYEGTSPPIAETLGDRPQARTTRIVRWLVYRCARLARYRAGASSPFGRFALSVFLTVLYLIGVTVASFGHLMIHLQARRRLRNETTAS